MTAGTSRRLTDARERTIGGNGTAETLQETLLPETPFPYLEKIAVIARKSPYAMLTIIVSIASVIIIAITTLSISVIGSVFVMYGKMSRMEATQEVIVKQLDKNAAETNLLRTYEASVLSRQNYAVGLMDSRQQERMNAYDRANPISRTPKQ